MKPRNIYFLLLPLVMACNSTELSSDGYGHFEATDIYLSAELAGRITMLMPGKGHRVMKGDTLFSIDTAQLSLKRDQLSATMEAIRSKTLSVSSELAVLRSKKEYLADEMNRLEKLFEAEAATQKQLDDLRAEQEMLDRQIEAVRIKLNNTNRGILAELEPIRANIKIVDDQISRSFGLSPINGIVLEKYAEVSEMTVPGKPILKVANTESMTLKVYLSAEQLSGVNIGDDVDIAYVSSDKTLAGKVSYIASEAEFTPKNVQTKDEKANLVYAVEVTVINNGDLRIGMPGEIRLNQ